MLVSGSPGLSWGKVGKFGHTYMPSTGSFDIKHLYFEKCPSHFGLSGRILGSFWGLLCSQPKPSLAAKSGKTADCCCFGLDAALSAAPLADWALAQVECN